MTDAQAPSLNPEKICRLLSAPDRRDLLSRLEPGEPTAVDELVREAATGNRDASIDDLDRAAARRIEISLVHDHLPRLADHGVITYAAENSVVLTEDPDTLRRLERLLEAFTPEP